MEVLRHKKFGEYEIQKHTALIHVASSHSGTKYHDLEDFSIIEAKRVCKIVDNHHTEFSISTIQLTFEVKLQCKAP
jgi:hypothetical protein